MNIDRPIAIAIILFVIILMMFFLVVPEYKTFKDLQSQLGEKISEFNAQHDYFAAVDKAYSDLQSRKDDLKKIDSALPQSSDVGATIYSLQEIAKENGLMIKNLSLAQSSSATAQNNEAGSNSIKNMIFSVNLLGNYSSLENFMASLEKSSRLFEVINVSFSSPSGSSSGSSQQTYSFSMQIKTQSY